MRPKPRCLPRSKNGPEQAIPHQQMLCEAGDSRGKFPKSAAHFPCCDSTPEPCDTGQETAPFPQEAFLQKHSQYRNSAAVGHETIKSSYMKDTVPAGQEASSRRHFCSLQVCVVGVEMPRLIFNFPLDEYCRSEDSVSKVFRLQCHLTAPGE